jgi:hypothetical protein
MAAPGLAPITPIHRQQLEDGWLLAEQEHIRLARTNMRAFFSYVMRDEETGEPIDLEPFQEEWNDLAGKHDRLVLWAFMESGKTSVLSVARTLWELGRDPTLRFVIVSATSGQAIKIASIVARYIESSEELHKVFPGLLPDASMPWNTEQLTVKRPTLSKDPSIQVLGIGGNIQGARVDRAILDDVLTRDNCHTAYMRDGTLDWYLKSIPGRLTKRGKVLLICNAFHPDDLAHRLAKNPRFRGFKFPILKKDGTSLWPRAWPPERIQARMAELGPIESKSQLMCQAISDALSRFRREWIDKCKLRGEGKTTIYALREIPAGCKVYIGVDLAVGRKKSNARTVYFVLLIHPNGDRQLLWIEAGRFMADKIMDNVVDLYQRFHGIFVVENVQAQDYLVQLLQKWTAIPIIPFTTGKNKADPSFGVEAMGIEFATGKWIIPNQNGQCDPEVQIWLDEMMAYHPDAHTGDSLMSSWFAKEGERLGIVTTPVVGTVKLKLSRW